MQRKLTITAVAALLIFATAFTFAASADLSVGVEAGDWIEYTVAYTGSPTQGHDVTWARIEVLSIQAPNISISITSRFSDGTTAVTNSTLNLATGHLIDDFIIPANLSKGDTFPDENYGTMTISTLETRSYAGASRTVLSASAGNNTYIWDQATGVSVEGTSQTLDYTIHTIVEDTNMWQPQPTPAQGFDYASLLLVAAVVLVIAVLAVALAARYLRHRACAAHKDVS